MVLSYSDYKDRASLIDDIRKEVLNDFKESDYKEDDKLSVSLHRVVDNFVSFISLHNIGIYLMWFNDSEKETLNKGLLPDEAGTEKFNRALLYCLIEQDLYNIDEINKLQ